MDILSIGPDAPERRAESFRLVVHPTTHCCAAAYYPETHVLVPLDS